MTIIVDLIKSFIVKYWKLILIILLGLVVYWFYIQNQKMRDENLRLMNNFEQIMVDNNTRVLELTKKELKKYNVDSLFKELKDSLNLNYRQIERTINHKFTYSFDTTITMIKENDSLDNYDLTPRKFRLKKDCVDLIATIDWVKNTSKIDTLDFDYNATTIIFWKRKHPILWFLSKKEYYPETINNCNGKTKITEIKIIKKK